MFCESCGAALKDGAKFCGSCGAKVSATPSSNLLTSINLAPLSAGLADCEIKITSVSAVGPDSAGDLCNIEVNYEISNQTDEDWDHLSVRVQLLSAAGQVVEESRDVLEQTVSAGETETLQASIYSLKAQTLGASPEKAHVIINIVGSTLLQQSLGEISIPANAFEPVALKPVRLGDAVQMITGSLWRTEPGDDKESQIEVKALVQNVTNLHLPEVKVVASVTDKSGRELTDAGGYDEVRPSNICVVSGGGWVKDKKLAGAKAELSIRAFVPVAAGIAQHCGVQITADSQSDEENETGGRIAWPMPTAGQSETSEDDDSDGGSDSSSEGERRILVRFAMTKGDGNWPQFAELPVEKQNLAYVVSCMEFSPSFDDVEESIVAWKIVDSGLEHLTFDKNGLKGYPTPTVEFTVSGVDDDDDFLRGVWESSYRLEIPELNDGDAYYFEDHNGNAQIVKSGRAIDMSLSTLVDKLATEFKADPRNKIFVGEEMLIASATEETGKQVTATQLRKVIAAFVEGGMTDKQESLYDAAVYAIGLSAKQCWATDPDDEDEEVDYSVSWIENPDGSYAAEVRPS